MFNANQILFYNIKIATPLDMRVLNTIGPFISGNFSNLSGAHNLRITLNGFTSSKYNSKI